MCDLELSGTGSMCDFELRLEWVGHPPSNLSSSRTEIAAIIMPSCVWRNYGVISNATPKSYLPPLKVVPNRWPFASTMTPSGKTPVLG